MHLTPTASLVLALLAVAAPASRAQTYSAAGDFSSTSNPNGVWSYGYEDSLGSTLNLYTATTLTGGGSSGWDSGTNPNVIKNFGKSDDSFADVVLHPGQLKLHPGANGEYSIVRFTAAQAGSYSLTGGFTPVTTDGTTTDVHVLENGTSLFDGIVTGTYNAPTSAPTFSEALKLKAGDSLDFAVGFGPDGSYASDSTGLTATLSAAPEPSQFAGLGLTAFGVLGLILHARKRKSAKA